jgi:cyanophycinase
MAGHILLEGGAEFGGRMADPDRRAMALAGGPGAAIAIIPAAAAPDHNDRHAGQNGVRWFRRLGATQVAALPLTDRGSAEDPALARALRESRLIYLLGGFAGYLAETLAGSACWQAVLQAYAAGAVVAGSSAGAMVLCEHLCDFQAGTLGLGLNLLPGACLIPHYDTFGQRVAAAWAARLPEALLIGIDEQTGLLDDAPQGQWSVYGQGVVTLLRAGVRRVVRPGQAVSL